MSISGNNPPSVCKVRLVRTLRTGESAPDDCTPVEQNFVYVVLSDNPDDHQSATVSWPGSGDIHVQVLPENNLMLRGETSHDTAPDTVTVQFEGCDPNDEACSVTTCVPEAC